MFRSVYSNLRKNKQALLISEYNVSSFLTGLMLEDFYTRRTWLSATVVPRRKQRLYGRNFSIEGLRV
jgi:hypothetical protein